MSEVRVLYSDGPDRPLRAVVGVIESEDDNFIVIRSRNLVLRIGTKFVARVEEWTNRGAPQ